MIVIDSTGGTSRRSGNSPVFSFDEFLSRLDAWGARNDDADAAWALFESVGYQRLVPYLSFMRAARLRGGGSVGALDALVELDGRVRAAIFDRLDGSYAELRRCKRCSRVRLLIISRGGENYGGNKNNNLLVTAIQ